MAVGLGVVGVVVASRMGSNRLPGKAMMMFQGIPMLAFLLRRIAVSRLVHKVVLATTNLEEDDVLVDLAKDEGVHVYRGAVNDVLGRYVGAARWACIDTIVRVTGDCPFVDGKLIDYCLGHASVGRYDLCTTKGRFPTGLDVEIFRSVEIDRLHESVELTVEEREHLTLYYYSHPEPYKTLEIPLPEGWTSHNRSFTVDTATDYGELKTLAEKFATSSFSLESLLEIGS